MYLAVLTRLPLEASAPPRARTSREGYASVARDRVFLRFAALNFLFVATTVSLLNSLFPVFARNEAGVDESAIGLLFLLNALVIIVAQTPVARAVEGRRRMRAFALMGALFACCWSLVAVSGVTLAGQAVVVLALAVTVLSLGECIYDCLPPPVSRLPGDPYRARSAWRWYP